MGKFKATSLSQFIKKDRKSGHKCCAAASCNRSDNRSDLHVHLYHFMSFTSDTQQRKKWEILMKRGDNFFAAVGNKFCCSEHFLLMDNKQSLTGLHVRRDLNAIGFLLD